jgi:hypothetical protein
MQSDDQQSSRDNKFFQYMMASHELSVETSKRVETRVDRSIDLFLALITALFGGALLILTSQQDVRTKEILISLIFFVAVGVGFLTYNWFFYGIVASREERVVRYFIHRYFKDLNPDQFRKYGRGIVLDNHFPAVKGARGMDFSQSLFAIALLVFKGAGFLIAVHLGWIGLSGQENYFPAIIAGIMIVGLSVVIWMRSARNFHRISEKGKKVLIELESEDKIAA